LGPWWLLPGFSFLLLLLLLLLRLCLGLHRWRLLMSQFMLLR